MTSGWGANQRWLGRVVPAPKMVRALAVSENSPGLKRVHERLRVDIPVRV